MIRILEKNDIKTCVNICNINFEKEGYSYDVEKEFLCQFTDSIIIPEFYVFEDNNLIKGVGGLCNCWFDDGVFGLCTCYVLPEFQGKGIGKALTKYRLERLKELGADIVLSTTQKTWHLKRFGFEVIKSPYKKWSLMQLILK